VTYEVSILKSALKHLQKLPRDSQERLAEAMTDLRSSPRPVGAIKLAGRDAYRIRNGDYRVIYEIDDDSHTILIVAIAHREDAYR
jgi:mRNA interferase RelE/StbE